MSGRILSFPTLSWAELVSHVQIPLYRNAYALIFSTTAASGLGFVYWALAARYYAPEAVGVNSAAIAALLFLSGVSGLYLDGALMRFIPRTGRGTPRLIAYVYAITVIVGAIVSIVYLLGIDIWSPGIHFLGATPKRFLGFVLAVTASNLFLHQDAVLTGLRQTVWVPIENSVYALVKIGLLLLLSRNFAEHGIFLSWVLPLGLLIPPVNWLIFRRLIPRHVAANSELALPLLPRQIAHYAGGLYLGSLFSLASSKLLPVIVLGYLGSSASAYFSLPWMIAAALQLVTASLTTSLTVEGARDPKQLIAYSKRILVQSARLVLPVAVVLCLSAPYILRVFGQDYSVEGTGLLRLLALAIIPHVLNSLYIGICRVQRRIVNVIVVQATLFGLLIALSYLWMPLIGIAGVGWAWLTSQTSVALILIFTQFGWLRANSVES